MISRSCAACGKQYRVPRADRDYACKACGATMPAVAVAIAQPVEGSEECPACSAPLANDQAFCEACGASLAEHGRAAGPSAPRARRSAVARAELGLVRGDLERAKRAMRFVRSLYLVGIVVSAVSVTWFSAALASGVGGDWLLPVLALISGLELVLFALGYWRGYREPLLWSVLIGSYRTLALLWTLLTFDWSQLTFGSVLGLLLAVSFTALLWVAVVRVARVRTLIAEHPEAWDALGELRRRGAGKGLDPASLGRRSRQIAAERGRRRRTLLIAGSAMVLLVLLGWGVRAAATRPPDFEPALAAFTRAWNASDVDEVTEHFVLERRDSVRRWLTRSTSQRDWSAGLPKLTGSFVEKTASHRRTVRHSTAEGSALSTSWRVEGRRWIATGAKADA